MPLSKVILTAVALGAAAVAPSAAHAAEGFTSVTAGGNPKQVTTPPVQPRPVHVRLVYTGGPFSPVSVVFTTTSAIPRVHGTDEEGPHIDAGAGVASNPSIRVARYGRVYQAYASSSVVKHLHIGHRYPVTIAIGHGSAERRFTRQITLTRATLKGTVRQLNGH